MPAKKNHGGRPQGDPEDVPDVRCILASDIHLQARAPVARGGEEDWFAAMARPLAELAALKSRYGCPVVYAGDIFDKWNAPPEVINFAIANLPHGYAVPGQHDLPNHNYGEIERSAYWTLVQAGVLTNLEPGKRTLVGNVDVTGFPWGFPPVPAVTVRGLPVGTPRLAVVHAFIYNTTANAYVGAPPTARASVARAALHGYDAAAYGDNHKGFIDHGKGLTICNCGGFMRRKVDERDMRPGVGLLLGDGTVRRHYLDTSADAFNEATEAEEQVGKLLDMGDFVAALGGLGAGGELEFVEALRRFLETNKTAPAVRDIVMAAATK